MLGVLIFLLLFLSRVFKSRMQILVGGLFYSLVVYLTYLALGFGILKVAVSSGIASIFYLVAAVIAIIAGLLEIKDYFWYGKGPSLQMIPGSGDRLKRYTKKIESIYLSHPRLSLFFVALLGVFVVLVELPCTGAPYFAVLALLAKGAYAEAVPYLLLYNFIFIVPLFIVTALAYFGRGERMESWRMEHRGVMRLIIGLFLTGLGIYMVYAVYPFW